MSQIDQSWSILLPDEDIGYSLVAIALNCI